MAYGDFKDLAKRTASGKVLRDRAFNIAENSKYDGYQRYGFLCFIIFLIKKSSGSGFKNKIKQNEQLTEELHKPIIRKFKKGKIYSSFKYNI